MRNPPIEDSDIIKYGCTYDPKTGTSRVLTPEQARRLDAALDRPPRADH